MARIKSKHTLPLKVLVVLAAIAIGLVLFVYIPAIIFTAIEGWTYRQSVYYCFVSLTTIGFGDFVPGQATSTDLPVGVRGVYKVCTACWLLFGISFLSLLIAELQKLFVAINKLQICKRKKPEDTNEPGKEGGGGKDGVLLEASNQQQTEQQNAALLQHKDVAPPSYSHTTAAQDAASTTQIETVSIP